MKKNLFLFCFVQCLYFSTRAQKFLLLDRRWDKEAMLTDSVTRQNLSDGWYPVYKKELDTLIVLADRLKNLRKDGLARKFYYSGDFKTANLKFIIENIKRAYGDSYDINLISSGPFGETTVNLSNSRELLNVNQKTIRSFLAYLKRAKKNMSKLKTK